MASSFNEKRTNAQRPLAILFPCNNFFASSLILLSPKRAMRQLCSLCLHNAQPLGTGRQPLNAVGRLILLFPKRCLCVNYARFTRIMRGRLWTGRHLLAQMDAILFPFTNFFVFLLYVHPRKRMTAIQSLSGASVRSTD